MSQDNPTPEPLKAGAENSSLDQKAFVADWRAEKAAQQLAKQVVTPLVNIGPRQRRLRNILGATTLSLSLLISLLLVYTDVEPRYRLLLFLPYWLAFFCLFQASEKVCVYHARKGTCDLDLGPSPIQDLSVATRLRAKATWVLVKTTFSALFWVLLVAVVHRKLFGWGP